MGSIEVVRNYGPDTAWHEIGAAGEPAFTNSWANYHSTWSSAAYRIDSEGWVHLKGLVASGSSLTAAVFTLPVGYRPLRTFYSIAISNNSTAYVTISTAGVVSFSGTGGASTAFCNLDNVKFPAWTSTTDFTPDRCRFIQGLPSRNTTSEFPLAVWQRDTGMVEIMGIQDASAAGTPVSWSDQPNVYSDVMVPVVDNTANNKYMQTSMRYNWALAGATTSFSIIQGEMGLFHIEDKWITPTLLNSWVAYGADTASRWPTAGYWKDTDGFVHVRGMLKSGSSATANMFTLPAGYRPAKTEMFMVNSNLGTSAARVDIDNTGGLACVSGGSTSWTNLGGICFYADG